MTSNPSLRFSPVDRCVVVGSSRRRVETHIPFGWSIAPSCFTRATFHYHNPTVRFIQPMELMVLKTFQQPDSVKMVRRALVSELYS